MSREDGRTAFEFESAEGIRVSISMPDELLLSHEEKFESMAEDFCALLEKYRIVV